VRVLFRPGERVDRLRDLEPARLAERQRQPDGVPRHPGLPRPDLVRQDRRRRKDPEPGRIIYDPGEKNQTIGNQIVVPTAGPAQGTLIDGFLQILTKGGKGNNPRAVTNVAALRSTDGGATWSAPVIVGQLIDAPVSIAGQAVRTGDTLPAFAANPVNGDLYALWQDGRFSPDGQAKIAFSQSADGGLTWSTPVRIDQSPGDVPAFTPQVKVRSGQPARNWSSMVLPFGKR
jgi:hypothetical protein